MNRLVFCFSLFVTFISNAQTSIGFIDNYSGVNTVIYNPANIVDNYLKKDFHLFSASLNFGNNAIPFSPYKLFTKDEFDYFNGNDSLEAYFDTFDFKEKTNIYLNTRALGPSYLHQIDRNTSIAFFTSIRANGYIYNLDGNLYNRLISNDTFNNSLNINDTDFTNTIGKGNVVSWAEIGLSYGKVLINKRDQFLKVGVTLKFLHGLQSFTYETESLEAELNTNLSEIASDFLSGEVTTEEEFNFDLIASADLNYEFSKWSTNYGQSIDLGFVYESRTNTLPKYSIDEQGTYYIPSPYRYKLSVSVTDLGFLNFDKVESHNYIAAYNTTDDLVSTDTVTEVKRTFVMPLTSHINFDYQLYKNWYVNSNLDLYMLSKSSLYTVNNVSALTISPRYETYNFSFFAPVSINQHGIFKSGLGIRTPYFFIGSSSLITNLTSYTNKSKEFDVFVGLKIPLINKKRREEFNRSLKHHRVGK